jgi:hypothetical protein
MRGCAESYPVTRKGARGADIRRGSASPSSSDPTRPLVFLLQRRGNLAARLFSGVAVSDFMEIAGTAFVGFLYIAILATAVTRKTRRQPTQPAHPDTGSEPDFDRAA